MHSILGIIRAGILLLLILMSSIIIVTNSMCASTSINNNNYRVPFYVSWILHIHQPYYSIDGDLVKLLNSPNCPSWLPSVWSSRADIYTRYIPWVALNMTGDEALQVDITGTLIDQLNQLEASKWHNCLYCGWKKLWVKAVHEKTSSGYPRLRILGTGYYHPIFPLIMRTGILDSFREQIIMHRRIVMSNFGVFNTKGFFPIEESFTPKMIPVLRSMGFEWTIVDSEQVLRATIGYNSKYEPAPNPYDARNPDPSDWDWGVSPQLVFRPHVVEYNGSSIVVFVRYRGISEAEMTGINVDYLISVIKHFEKYNTDPRRPFIMVIVHDGENGFPYQEWGGHHGYQYYINYLIEFLHRIHSDPSLSFIKVIGLDEYLEKIYDPRNDTSYKYSHIWVEPGSWETMSTWGDPVFAMWNYPQINSVDQRRWGEYVKALNYYLTVKKYLGNTSETQDILNWIMRGEGSDYYYWDGNEWWDVKALKAFSKAEDLASTLINKYGITDEAPPVIRWAWREPYNPTGSVTIYYQVYDLNSIRSIYALIYVNGEYLLSKNLTRLGINNFYKLTFSIVKDGVYSIIIKVIDNLGNTNTYDYTRPFYAYSAPLTMTMSTRTTTPSTGYIMDGLPDLNYTVYVNNSNRYVKHLWAKLSNGILYVATDPANRDVDVFIFISLNPFETRYSPPWKKEGWVARYDFYLGEEGSNGWSGWFRYGDKLLRDNEHAGSAVGRVLEGYINLTYYLGYQPVRVYISVGVYETPDHGRLLETLIRDNGDQYIEPEEYTMINSTQAPPPPISEDHTVIYSVLASIMLVIMVIIIYGFRGKRKYLKR
jgi:hypothetical protein